MWRLLGRLPVHPLATSFRAAKQLGQLFYIPLRMPNRKKNNYVYYFLGGAFLLLAAVIGFLLLVPSPLSPVESSLVGAWKSDYEKEMTFQANRVVLTDTGVYPPPTTCWKIEGNDLLIREGRGPWDRFRIAIKGDSFTLLDAKPPVVFNRIPEMESQRGP